MAAIKSITYYCDPDTLGEISLDAFKAEFRRLAQVQYPQATIDVTTERGERDIESTDDDFDPIDEYEQIDGIAEKAFAAACEGSGSE